MQSVSCYINRSEFPCDSGFITPFCADQSTLVRPDRSASSTTDNVSGTSHLSQCLYRSPSAIHLRNYLNVSHVNINSITAPNRQDELEQFANSNNIHVLCLTETKLDETVSQSLYTLQAFSLPFTKHRTRQGGGVAIFIRNNLACTRLYDLELDGIEWIWVKLRTKKHTVIISCIYYPPNQNIANLSNFLDKFSDSAIQAQKHIPSLIMILGDFNLGNVYLSPEHINHSGVTSYDVLFQDTMYDLNLKQLICEPTRITNQTANLRDLILVSGQQHIAEYGLLSPFSQIDHIPTFATVKFNVAYNTRITKKIWNYRAMDIDKFIHIFESKDWTEITNNELGEAVNALTKFILDASNQCIPKRDICIKGEDKPWVRKALKIQIRKRNKLFQKAKTFINEASWKRWKEQRNLVTAMNRKLKNSHITHQVKKLLENKQNPRQYHQILKGMIGRKRKFFIPPLIDENNEQHEDNMDKANLLNDFFANQSRLDMPKHAISPALPDRGMPTLQTITITDNEVFNQLKALKINKSTGSDGIPNKILKMVAIFLKDPLAKLFNKSLAEGKYPYSWKHATIISVFKNKGSASDVKSYRPISLLPSMSKVFERIVYNRIYEHLIANRILTDRQSAYRQHHGTYTQLLYLNHSLHNSLDNCMDFSVIYLDISRYFDKIWHYGLLAKCEKLCGIKGALLNWLKSYLHNRTHSVLVENSMSETRTINAGCPQGSVLGPLLALIYLNDLDGITENELFLFADDTILFKSHAHNSEEAQASIQRDLNKIREFGNKWAITFNSSKTTQQTFTNKRTPISFSLKFGSDIIPIVTHHKHLGLNISSDLRFHYHMKETIKKANAALAPLYPVATHMSRLTLNQIYLSYIRPIFDYADVVYHGHITATDSLRLEKVQNRVARLITGAFRRTSTDALLRELGWTPLHIRRDVNSLYVLHRIRHNAPNYLLDIIPATRYTITKRSLRNSSNISLPRNRLSSFKSSFFPATIRRWNRMPEKIKSIECIRTFKQAVAQFYDLTKPPLYNSLGFKIDNILHARLRMGLSSLNDHLFRINSSQVDSPNCHCEPVPENIRHFFFICPKYSLQRKELERSLKNMMTGYDTLSVDDKIAILLNGRSLDKTAGRTVAACVQRYIRNTKRFGT